MFGKHILLLIPHPDDEVVGCFSSIRKATALGGKVFGFYMTTGIPSREVLWAWQRRSYSSRLKRRRNESLVVANRLCVEPVWFLETPSRMLKDTLKHLREPLIQAINQFKIDMLWVPAYEGGHQDHDTANFIASTMTGHTQVWEFSEYNYFGGKMRSQTFFSLKGTEQSIVLDRPEQKSKQQTLSLYTSERKNLWYVRTRQETFRPLVKYDYTRPPHRGKLFYQRFQWVPRHPRIDYCNPADVCQAFVDYLNLPGGNHSSGAVGIIEKGK